MNLALKAESVSFHLIFSISDPCCFKKKKFRVTCDSYVYLINQRAFSNLFFYVYALGILQSANVFSFQCFIFLMQ